MCQQIPESISKVHECQFQIDCFLSSDSQRKYFRSAKPVSIRGEDIARYGGFVTMDFTTGKIFAYKSSLKNHNCSRIVKVFSFQRRQSKQESWSIRRIGTIPIDRNTLTYIVQMQFTDFNSQLVLLSITINYENIIWFQYQTDAQNPEPEIWRINQSICADWMHSSPSTGKVYLAYLRFQKIDEYGFSDGLHIRTISFNFFKKSDYFFRCFRFHNADDQLHVGIGANRNVATSSPIVASDEQLHLSVRKLRRRPMWFLTCVADKYNNMLLLTNEGASYGLYLAPANRMERIRLLVEIPDLNPYAYGGNHMVFDEGRGLVFLSLAGRKQIYCVRVARMN